MRYWKWVLATLFSATMLAGCQRYSHNVRGYSLTGEAAEALEIYRTVSKEADAKGRKPRLPPEAALLKRASRDIFVDGNEMHAAIIRTLLEAASSYLPGREIHPPFYLLEFTFGDSATDDQRKRLPVMRQLMHQVLPSGEASRIYKGLEYGFNAYPYSVNGFFMTKGAYVAFQDYKRVEMQGGELTVNGQRRKPDKKGKLMPSEQLLELAAWPDMKIETDEMDNAVLQALAETAYQDK